MKLGPDLRYLGSKPRRKTAYLGPLKKAPSGEPRRQVTKVSVPSDPVEIVRHERYVIFGCRRAEIVAFDVAASKEAWRIVIGKEVDAKRALFDVSMKLFGQRLLVQSGQYLLVIDASSGTVKWSGDVAEALDVPWFGGIMAGGVSRAEITGSGSVAIVAYENRIFGFDVVEHRVLWSLMPDTMPFRAYPVSNEKRVFIVAGKRRTLSLPK